MHNKFIYLFIIIIFSACTPPKKQNKNSSKSYFDLEHYFKQEALHLAPQNRPILKKVVVNGKTEEKQVKIYNWEKEFDAFIKADMNKAAWKGEFNLQKNALETIYSTTNEKIPVKKVLIKTNSNQTIKSIQIFIATSNYLYQAVDTLSYYPDSLYKITSNQKIKLLDPKRYEISGVLK